MNINSFEDNENILTEVGQRIKKARVRSKLTQAELAKKSGAGKSTVERAERGQSIQLLNLIKILRTLNQLDSLNTLLPSTERTPMEYLMIRSPNKSERVYQKRNPDAKFKWGDDE